MPGKIVYQVKLFLSFSLSERIPENNFYLQLKKVFDLQFEWDMSRPYYGSEGQKSIDPTLYQALYYINFT
jgi:hypothetical protein